MVGIRRNYLDGATEQKIENEIGEITRTLIVYGFVCQNKDFGFFSRCNGKTLEGIQKKSDKDLICVLNNLPGYCVENNLYYTSIIYVKASEKG